MGISAALAADLNVLNAAIDDPDTDLDALLHALTTSLAAAVASYQGLTMTLAVDNHDISFTVRDSTSAEAGAAATSLLIPVPALSSADAESRLVLYATAPGAFVDLAADLTYALGLDDARLILDKHRAPPDGSASAGIAGLHAHTAINQAIGVLIDRGHTQESAHRELHRRANLDSRDLLAVAEQILRSIAGAAAARDDRN